MKGTIKTWHHRKGFGFIAIDDGEDVFLHITDIPEKQKPEVGEEVTFDIGPGRDGKTKAINVQLHSQLSTANKALNQEKGVKFGLVLVLAIVAILVVGALVILL